MPQALCAGKGGVTAVLVSLSRGSGFKSLRTQAENTPGTCSPQHASLAQGLPWPWCALPQQAPARLNMRLIASTGTCLRAASSTGRSTNSGSMGVQSCVDVSFWAELAERKLTAYKLSEDPVTLTARLSCSRYTHLPGQLLVDTASFPAAPPDPAEAPAAPSPATDAVLVPGTLLNTNTPEGFRALDLAQLLHQAGAAVWADILSGAAVAEPGRLARFLLLTHADLKRYHFTYWFAFPALKPPAPFTVTSSASLKDALGQGLATQVCRASDQWRSGKGQEGQGREGEQGQHQGGSGSAGQGAVDGGAAGQARGQGGEAEWEVWTLPLSSWAAAQQWGNPGWPLRNLLLMAAVHWGVQQLQVRVLGVARGRGRGRSSKQGNSSRQVDLGPLMAPHQLAEQAVDLNLRLMKWRAAPALDLCALNTTKCLLLGAGTLGCAVARTLLAWGVRSMSLLDSGRVAYSNPVRQSLFSFQDCLEGGKPKAQAAAEALRGIFPAVQASAHCLAIPMPGHPASSPAAEHAMQQDTEELDRLVQAADVVFLLTDTRESRWLPALLAAAHGKLAITSAVGFDTFLVMRHGGPPDPEPCPSAPLPTPTASLNKGAATEEAQQETEPVAASSSSAAASSAAAGGPHEHDATHPTSVATPKGDLKQPRLGCYFCNDVVAPLNSTKDRTLDQQCTVARPGLASIAGAVAVELMAALLQHPQGLRAPPPPQPWVSGQRGQAAGSAAQPELPLGPVPHMVRGCLSGFTQTCMEAHAFSQCTACSHRVVDAYQQGGWAFLSRVIQEPGYLEELTGLAALQASAADLMAMAGSDDEDAGRRSGSDDFEL
ncbi:E1-like protein-activating [Haematococcus lacustris]